MFGKSKEGQLQRGGLRGIRRAAGIMVLTSLTLTGCGEANANGLAPGSGTAGSTPYPQSTATGMAETPTPYPTVTPAATAAPLPTPYATVTATDIYLKAGNCIDLPTGGTTAYVVKGDVLVGTDANHLQRGYDNLANTGMELTIEGSQQATVCAPYGADVTPIPGANPQVVNQQENESIQDLRRSGCENGCTAGVQTFLYQDSNLVFQGMK